MKKFLLSCALVAAFTASAEEVTFDFVNNNYGLTRESGSSSNYLSNGTVIENEGVNIELNNLGTGSTNWRLWSDGLRATKAVKGEMTITIPAGEITGVSVTIANNATNVSFNGAEAVDIAKGASYEWEENTEKAVLLFTQSATMAVSKLTVTYLAGEVIEPDGSEENPYLIATAEDLCKAWTLTKAGEMVYFKQVKDIDMKGVTEYHAFVGFDNNTYSSQITYDGQYHLIKNFSIKGEAYDATKLNCYNTSIFGVLNGTVKNLGVVNVDIDGPQGCGVIAAYAGHSTGTSATLENVFVTGKIKGTGYLGGLLGTSGNAVEIVNCFVNAEISGTNYTAGLIGRLQNDAMIMASYTAGTVTSTNAAQAALLVNGNTSNPKPEVLSEDVIAFNTGAEAFTFAEVDEEGYKVATPETEAQLIEEVKEWMGYSSIDMVLGYPGLDDFGYAVYKAPVMKSIEETIAQAANSAIGIGYDLTVAYVNGLYVFAYAEDGEFMQLYGANNYKVGDVISAGWEGIYAPYNGMPEIKPATDGQFPAATSNVGEEYTPAEVAAADVTAALVNHVILVKDVVFADATPATKTSVTGTVGETSLTFFNQFTVASVEAGTYNVTAIVALYKGNVQLYVVGYEKSTTSGIEELEVAEVEAVYYNLQGVKIANPAEGQVVIVRRGSKVTKEVIR